MSTSAASAIHRLARFAADRDRRVPESALHASARALADTLACMAGGCRLPATQSALQACERWGAGEARVFGHASRLAPPGAALVNGTAAHALDYDDYDVPANGHPSAVIFPAVMALADTSTVPGSGGSGGSGASGGPGHRLLDAHVTGVEIMLRLGEAMNMAHYKRGWHTTLTIGSIAAAGACARWLGLDEAQCRHALSLGTSMASGLTNQGGYAAKPVHAGLAARNGLEAASLAASGVDANPAALDGPVGVARVMGEYDTGRFAAAMAKVGRPLAIEEHGLIAKPYPSCSYTHRIIDAALAVRAELTGGPAGIRSVVISVPDYYLDLLAFARPASPAEAMFSAEYAVAAALVDGAFGLDSLDERARTRPVMRELLDRCEVSPRSPPDPDLTLDPTDPDRVIVVESSGRRHEASVAMPRGSAVRPLSEDDLVAKARDCGTGWAEPEALETLVRQAIGARELPSLAPLMMTGATGAW